MFYKLRCVCQNTLHFLFYRKTVDEIQAMERRLSTKVVNVEIAFTKMGKNEEKDNRKAISELKPVNLRLKRKLDE